MTLSSSELTDSLRLFEYKPGKRVSYHLLQRMLPDVETALFFAKTYELNSYQVADLLRALFSMSILEALTGGEHSTELQDYLIDVVPASVMKQVKLSKVAPPPQGEILPELWAQLDVEVAASIKEVANTLSGVLDRLPGKNGELLFRHLMKVNKQRPTIGTYGAVISHAPTPDNLVILDVSGSMTEGTIRTIIGDVVALSYKANASLAIVSDNCFFWEPGTYDVDTVLDRCEFNGTHYETLSNLFTRPWGTVITIADYDSSLGAKQHILDEATAPVGQVLDISLVNKPTFLAEVVGQLAEEVRPLLIAATRGVLSD